MLKLTILTTVKKLESWNLYPAYKKQILKALNSGDNGKWALDVRYVDVTPKVVNERIDKQWLDALTRPYYNDGSDIVAFHMSDSLRKKIGLKPTLRGLNPNRDNSLTDVYFWSNEKTQRKGLPQFVQTLLHEVAHEYYQQTKTTDITHLFHKNFADITPLFSTFDWALFQPRRQQQKTVLKLAQRVFELMTQLLAEKPQPTTLQHPVDDYKSYVSQKYGVPNTKWYPLTGHHIGTDYATPVSTKVQAPWAGRITASGNSPSLGNYCIYTFNFDGVTYACRFMHLSNIPIVGQYDRGEVIAKTGNTGNTTGAHLHIDVFYNEVRLDILNKANWRELTIDPEILFS